MQTALPTVRRNHISYSSLSTFAACPLRYYFRYVLGLPEKTAMASLVLGAGIHKGLQHHFEQLLAGKPPPRLGTLLDIFWDSWHGHSHQDISFGKGEDLNSTGRLAERLFRAFQESSFSRPEGRIIAVEEELRGEIIPGLPDLLARVDLMVDAGEALEVIDFKTARSAWTSDHAADAADQLVLYGELAKDLSDGKPLRLQFAVLTKTKTPQLVLHTVARDAQRVARTKQVVRRVWSAIQEEIFYPAPSPLNCCNCPYREPCRAWPG
jgi:CRISPR/Cas system-associated exonuclease Cas4 (RecB family)